MQKEAQEAAQNLEEEAVPVVGVGTGEDTRPIRKKVVEEREKTRGSVLIRALALQPVREARPVWVWSPVAGGDQIQCRPVR